MTETDVQFQSNWRGIRLELEGSLKEIVLQVALNEFLIENQNESQ